MDSLYITKKPVRRIKTRKTFIKVIKREILPKELGKSEFYNYPDVISESKESGDKNFNEMMHSDKKISFLKLYFEACAENDYRSIFSKKINPTTDDYPLVLCKHDNTGIKQIQKEQYEGISTKQCGKPYVKSEVVLELDYDL